MQKHLIFLNELKVFQDTNHDQQTNSCTTTPTVMHENILFFINFSVSTAQSNIHAVSMHCVKCIIFSQSPLHKHLQEETFLFLWMSDMYISTLLSFF